MAHIAPCDSSNILLTYNAEPTLTPTVGLTFIELHAVIAQQQIKIKNILFMKKTLRMSLRI